MGADGKGKKELVDLDDPLESGIIPVPTVKPPPGEMREREITVVDDDLTEQARLASVLIDSIPPRTDGIRARLAPLDRIPTLAKSIDELGSDLQEPKTAFVLGFIDGVLPLETIIEVTGLPEQETLCILDALIAQGAVVFPKRR
jgi:hypothetical protein